MAHSSAMAGMSQGSAQTAFLTLRQKYGNSKVQDANEMQEIMQLVSAYLLPSSWQYCTINAWLTGTPSEDDLDFFGNYFTNMPRLEDVCGDHTFLSSQFKEAFDDLKAAGAPADFITWLNVKGTARRYKTTETNQEGEDRFDQAVKDAARAGTIGASTIGASAIFAVLFGMFLITRR